MSWYGGGVGKVDELIHGSVGNELMHKVAGKADADELIHCGHVGRVDELSRRRRWDSGWSNIRLREERVDARSCEEGGQADTLWRCGEG